MHNVKLGTIMRMNNNLAALQNSPRPTEAEMQEYSADHEAIAELINEYKEKITKAIENNTPLMRIKIPKYRPFNSHKWEKTTIKGKFPMTYSHSIVIKRFFDWADSHDLVGVFSYEQNSSTGEDWFEVRVELK